MRGVRAPYLMLACYYSQGKQLASGVIGLLTCQSHCNVSGINRTPCASLPLRHPLAQRIPTEACECSVTGVLIIHTCILTHLHRVCTHLVPNHPHLSQPLHIPHSPFTRCLVSHFKRKHAHWIS